MPLAHAPSVGLEPIRLDQVRCSHDQQFCVTHHLMDVSILFGIEYQKAHFGVQLPV